MVTKEDLKIWKNFQKEYANKLYQGMKKGLVRVYDEELLSNLRHVYCGGVPASILLLTRRFANGHCYDRAHLVTMGFGDDEYQTVYGSVNSLRLNPLLLEGYRTGKKDEFFSDHCIAERTLKDGTTWVYDTSIGFVIEKEYYYEIENFKVRQSHNKDEIKEFLKYDFLSSSNIDEEKYVLPFIIPAIESNLEATQSFYLEDLQREIAIMKVELDYPSLCEEVKKDMQEKGFIL